MIKIDNFTLKKSNFVLKDINLEIKDNETIAILGESGAGKTLLLESIAGLYNGNRGKILFNNFDVKSISENKRNIGFVYQDLCLFNHMSVKDNISYGLKIKKENRAMISDKIYNIAKKFNIENILTKYPNVISGGEKQRVAICRSLILNPQILLLDEPFSAIDPCTKNILITNLQDYKNNHKPIIILVTHDFTEAKKLADKIYIMINGEIKETKTPQNLFIPTSNWEVNKFLQCHTRENII